VSRRLRRWRGNPWLSGDARREIRIERRGGHPVDAEHRPHLAEALAWLERAQDATPDDGFARGYSLAWNGYFGGRGWQPSYPETTGYIIPTLYEASRLLARPDLAERAERAARWEIEIQLGNGAVRGGVMGQPVSPAVFNTGQVIFGWLCALEQTKDRDFADAIRQAGSFLVGTLDADGLWRRGSSKFARAGTTLYNARTAWALAEAGVRLSESAFTTGAARALTAIIDKQHENGWIPDCCLSDAERPLLHTLAYAVRGLLEGGRVLEDDEMIQSAMRAAVALKDSVRSDGWMPGRYAADWSATVPWSCLTGQAQSASIWLRLFSITGDAEWLQPVPAVLSFIKSTQNRSSESKGVRGGIKGSAPVGGGYGTYQILNWATKFFVDALIRDQRVLDDRDELQPDQFALA
jgi:hypothetical protein